MESTLTSTRTLSSFHGTEFYMHSLIKGTGMFLISFSVSMALGVAFGLAMSLILKHSSLSMFPAIESCLVALSAYTSYFFSNGLSMSGIVSLLFCGITLKHYAYHTMSRRTQRTTKYIFATLAQLSENFIFIYLGLSLFTAPPSSAKVTSYFKPLFIIITAVAVVFTRYAAVFPLSEMINFFLRHARGQRQEELPHSYQMMLFWAGLRGAVGVALAAGFKGENAETLRTTVLVVVVLTVVVFGGTTARMLEVLGIRTGVEDDAASESDEEEPARALQMNGRRGRWPPYVDDELSLSRTSSFAAPSRSGGVGPYGWNYNHHTQSPGAAASVFSAASSEEYDSDGGEVLPLATTAGGPSRGGRGEQGAARPEDSKWFQEIDERYLLPLFSNATASRTFHARRARRSAHASGELADPTSENDAEDDGGAEVELGLPRRSSPQEMPTGSAHRESSRSERGLSSPALRNSESRTGFIGPSKD
jgi:sodium/hydrogen exchanger-like protein 6/7